MTERASPTRRGPTRRMTGGQRSCLASCLIVALLGAGGMVALGWWARSAMRRDPARVARLLFSSEPESPIRAEPGGIARRIELDVLIASTAAWSRDGRTVALCCMPGMNLRRLMPGQQVAPWDIPRAQREQQQRVRESLSIRVFLVDASTGVTRALPPPEPGTEAEEALWWPDGRLLVFTQQAYSFGQGESRDMYASRRLWLVNPADNRAEQVAEIKGFPQVAAGDYGVALSVSVSDNQTETYVLLPKPARPELVRLPAGVPARLGWDALGNLYAWGSGAKGERWALARVFLPQGTVGPCLVRETPERSTAPLGKVEVLTTRSFPPGSKTRAFYALNLGMGLARRLSEALPDTANYPRAALLHGGWVLVDQERYRNGERVHRLYGYCLAQGRFYPITDWGSLEVLATRGSVNPAGDLLLLQKVPRAENALRVFTSGLRSETWVLRLDERQILAQEPSSAEEWKIKSGEECSTGG